MSTGPSSRKVYASPFRLLAIVAASVFVIEALVMILLLILPPMTPASDTLLDALLLTVLIYPVLYRYLVRPMNLHIDERRRAEAALRHANDDLETRVRERTGELAEANAALRAEIIERQSVGDELRASEERYRSIVETATEGIWLTDSAGITTFVNQRMAESLGCSVEEMVGTPASVFVSPMETSDAGERLRRRASGTAETYERRLRNKDGVERWFLVSGTALKDAQGNVTQTVSMLADITERKEREEELHQLNRTLRAHTTSIQAMMRAENEPEYLQEVCKIVIEDCGHEMVWIGFAEEDEAKTVRPAAYAGFEQGYLETLGVTWAETERGRGPTGTAIRTGQPSLCRNMLTDPNFRPWREEAIKRGYASSIVFPLLADGKAFGALSIYSREPDPFSANEIELLSDLANDLAFGITAIRLRAAHAKAEEALRQLSRAVEQSPASVVITDLAGNIEYVNPKFTQATGYSFEEARGNNPRILKSGQTPAQVYQQLWDTITAGGQWQGEFCNKKKNGELYWESASISPIANEQGVITHFVAVKEDITARKQVEEALRESQADLNRAQAVAHTGSWRLDVRRNELRWSDETYRMFGLPGGTSLTYETFLATLHPDDRDSVDRAWQAALRGAPYDIEHRIIVAGAVKWVRERAQLEFDPQGTLLGGFGTVQDITGRKQSEERMAWLASFPELNPTPVVEVDLAGNIYYLNPAARRLLPDLAATGHQHVWLADLESIGKRFQSYHAGVLTREVTLGEACYQQTLNFVASRQRVRIYSVDINERKKAEEQRERLLAQVEQARQHAEELALALQAERDILDTIMENTEAQLAYLDLDLNFVRVNSAYAHGSGHGKEELLGRNHFEWFPDAENQAIFERVRDTGEAVAFYAKPFEFVGQPERSITYWDWTLVPVKDEVGRVQGLVFSLTDVTDLKRAEEALRKARDELELRVQQRTAELARANEALRHSRERLTQVIDASNDGYWEWDLTTGQIWMSPRWYEILGYQEGDFDLTVEAVDGLVHPDDLPHMQRVLKHCFERTAGADRYVFEHRYRGKHGDWKWVLAKGLVTERDENGKAARVVGILSDIVERKRAEDQLRIQTTAVRAAANGIIITDRRGTILWSNPAFSLMTGYPAEEVFGQNLRFLKSGQHTPDFYRHLWETIRAGQVWHGETVNRRKDGSLYTEEQTITPVLDESGDITHFIAIKKDITERKQSEEAIRLHAARAEALSEVARALTAASLDYQSVLDIVGQSGARLTGGSCVIHLISEDGHWLKVVAAHYQDPLASDSLRQSLSAHTHRVDEGLLGQVVQTGQPILLPTTSSQELGAVLRPEPISDVERFGWMSSTVVVPLRLRGRIIGVLTGWRDQSRPPLTPDDQLTLQRLADQGALSIDNARLYRDLENALREEQEMREQLVQTEKFAAMGRMIAAVAHELNNPLQTIENCLYLTQQEIPLDAPMHEYLDMAASESRRLSNLVTQLRQLFRSHIASPMPCLELNPILGEVRAMLAPQLDARHVEWRQTTLPDRLQVHGIADQLKQVFLNIGVNAIEAMQPAGGALFVSALVSPDAGQVGILFQDTGAGIPPENLSKLFEPFFTTKSSGLGLGLPICYEIIQRHDGHITVDSQPGQGTAFTVWLPFASPELQSQEHMT